VRSSLALLAAYTQGEKCNTQNLLHSFRIFEDSVNTFSTADSSIKTPLVFHNDCRVIILGINWLLGRDLNVKVEAEKNTHPENI